MILPQHAAVRPHVSVTSTTGGLLLEDQVLARIDESRWGFVCVIGPPGSGKTTAIGHLANVFQDDSRLELADEPETTEVPRLAAIASQKLVVFTAPNAIPSVVTFESWRINSWGQDDWIEYLLATRPDRCTSVMRRILSDPDRSMLSGLPQLWSTVLDRLATDESLGGVKAALRCELHSRLIPTDADVTVREYCFDEVAHKHSAAEKSTRLAHLSTVAIPVLPLLRHTFVQTLLAAEFLAQRLRLNEIERLIFLLPAELLRETAELMRDDKAVLNWLRKLLNDRNWATHAMAASLLNFVSEWRPKATNRPLLCGAYLPGVRWRGLRIEILDIEAADFTAADLSESRVDHFQASRTRMSGATLHGSHLEHLQAKKADLENADLSYIRSASSDFSEANLQNATLEGALLRDANFCGANLTAARLCRADLTKADFAGATIDQADFTGACLNSAKLPYLILRTANFKAAHFANAILRDCDLENMQLPGADFTGADLSGAHLTGTQMPRAVFRGANLRSTGLAEIDWEGADLRDADLRHSTFHMGSSRSGLVGSPLACEGSRTGFYTDELQEQEFKSPEEIRKANLCRADLRGAILEGVDFYLVDLRGAYYTAKQAEHFRRCGAILETRV